MNNLINEINGKRYVLIVDYFSTPKGLKECQKRIIKYNCILQGLFFADKAAFGNKRATNANILVPEENIILFNKELISLD